MNISYRWLRELAPGLEDDPAEVARRLALLGVPVDQLRPLAAGLGDILVARVESAARHPDADRLTLCAVDAGTGELLPVVCGAPNVRPGAYYPFAPVGASLPGNVKIRKARIRGQESRGMLCSERELGLGREHAGIMELPGAYTPGHPFVAAAGLDDHRLLLDVTPNRPDLLSHIGVARELAPGGVAGVVLPAVVGREAAEAAAGLTLAPSGAPVPVTIEHADDCPRYIGVVIRGVRVQPSPGWLAARLRAVGLRPINNIVDVTNYILVELGQPLHAFDLQRIRGGEIRVRRARPGETLVTLDGERRLLPEGALVIADAERPVAIAGIMGGEDSEVAEETTDLLLECALFDSRTVRRARRALDLPTEASQRFERGVDPDGLERAVRRAAGLILELAGGRVEDPAADARGTPAERPGVALRPARVEQVLGVAFQPDRLRDLLEEIGFRASGSGPADLVFDVPGYRLDDVTGEIDLIEEVARRHGYEAFPDELRPYRPGTVPDDPLAAVEGAVRALLAGRGLLEVRSVPFVPARDGEVPLLLPLSAEEGHLRASLVPGLLRRLEHNFARGTADVRLFEIGTVFGKPSADGVPRESTRVGFVLTGGRQPPHWSGAAGAYEVWDVKGLLAEVAQELCLAEPRPAEEAMPAWLGAERFVVHGGAVARGWGGRASSGAIDAPAWAAPVWVAELELVPAQPGRTQFRALPAYPGSDRDLALVAPDAVPAAAVAEAIRSAGGGLLAEVALFDVYRGGGVPAGTRSLAYRLRFRAADRTLVDHEVDAAVARVLARLEELDVRRR
jgi:phenylalanyl-tRNA synthetase beta chain